MSWFPQGCLGSIPSLGAYIQVIIKMEEDKAWGLENAVVRVDNTDNKNIQI